MGVEEDFCRERVCHDPEPIGMASRHIEHALARPCTGVAISRERQIPHARGVLSDQPPVVRIEPPFQEPAKTVDAIAVLEERCARAVVDDTSQHVVAHRFHRDRLFGRQPSVPAVPRRIEPELRQPPVHGTVPAVLEPLEVSPHLVSRPALVACEFSDVIPVGVVRIHEDHGVVRGASAEGAGARVVDAVHARPARVFDELRVAPLPLLVAVVTDEERPGHRVVF